MNKYLLITFLMISILLSIGYVGFIKYYPEKKEISYQCQCLGVERSEGGYCDKELGLCTDADRLCKGVVVNC